MNFGLSDQNKMINVILEWALCFTEKLTRSQQNGQTATVGGATWRHLHGIEARSDERRRRNAWGEGRRWHAYRSGKNRRLERAHPNHWLLHRRNLTTFTGIYWTSLNRKLFLCDAMK